MPAPRAPWWIYLVAASFLAFFCFTTFADVVAPEPAGNDVDDYAQGNLHLSRIAAGSALSRAGVIAGDRVLAVNGNPMRTRQDWRRARMRFRAGEAIDLDVDRHGERFHVPLVLNRGGFVDHGSIATAGYVGYRVTMLAWTLIAFLLILLRPEDLSARLAALVIATLPAWRVIVAVWSADPGWVASWRRLPWLLSAVLAVPALSSVAFPEIMFLLCAVFPRAASLSLRRLLLWCVPGLLVIPAVFHVFWPVYEPPRLVQTWQGTALLAWTILAAVYLLASPVVLAVNYRRVLDQNERRRVRAILPAVAASLPVGVHLIVTARWADWFGVEPPIVFSRTSWAIDAVLFLFLPLSIAYAILRHRIFDISVVIRRGMQYLLARRVLVSTLPALGLVILLDVALHREQTIGAVAAERGWLYAVIGGAALIARQKQRRWLDTLDRRFFRERYNAEHLLRETAEELRAASSLEQIAPRVVARIESSLHPEFAAVLLRGSDASDYRALASAPAGFSPPFMRADSKLVGLLRLLGKPLQIAESESGWLTQQLPPADTEFLRRTRIDLFVPVSLSAVGREALLVLGQKKSEEPYGADDLELLIAIANGLGLLLERPATAVSGQGLEECPRCGSCYDSGVGRCSQDGTRLLPSAAPRVLAGRYRLDRWLGRGGMGTVYSALDTALERQVALKLIRDDLLSSADAAERFRREARAAAAVTHPNLVTLYDFSVDSGGRAFLVMELLSGATLRQHVRQHGKLAAEAVLDIVRGVCSGLAVAHERGLIHRDLKPENVFLAQSGGRDTPKILDFGLAKFVTADVSIQATALDTGADVLMGTPRYMSPEQLSGTPVARSWDLWALAVIIYEALSGVCPFGRPEAVATLHAAVLSGRFDPIQAHVPAAPARWQAFFSRALNVEVGRRPGSALDLLSECEQALQD
jgi:tRNA A-37 threonylcarbamoyl transferase component Bud32